jgi:WD40 repeat protein
MQEFDMTKNQEPPTPLPGREDAFTRMKRRQTVSVTTPAIVSREPGAIRPKKRRGCFARLLLFLLLLAVAAAAAFWLYRRHLDSVMAQSQVRVIEGSTKGVWKLVYSPDGRYLAVTGPPTYLSSASVRIIDVAGGATICILPSRGDMVSASDYGDIDQIAFSPDGRRIALVNDVGVRIFDAFSGAALFRYEGPLLLKSADLCFSPDGGRFAARLGGVTCWSSDGKRLLRYEAGLNETIGGPAFDMAGGLLFSVYRDDTLYVYRWMPEDYRMLLRATMPSSYLPGSVCFAQSGAYLAYVDDSHLFVFDLLHPAVHLSSTGDFDRPRLFRFLNHDSLLLVERARNGISRWDVVNRKKLPGISIPFSSTDAPFYALSADGQTCAVTIIGDQRCEVWDLRRRRKLRDVLHVDAFLQYRSDVNVAAVSPDGLQLATGEKNIRLWSLKKK